MAATIKDIARRLNISVSTVSYALNGGPRNVPEAVKARVFDVAKEIGYRPNRVARSMVTRRTNTFGIIPTEASSNLAVSPYFQFVLNGVLNAAETIHHDIVLFTGRDQKHTDELTNSVLDGRVDGLIFLAPPTHNPIFRYIQDAGLPFVIVSSTADDAVTFICDNAKGVDQAIRHLAQKGHRKIGTLHGRQWMVEGSERLQAFRDSVAAQKLESCPEWQVDGDFTREGGYTAGIKLLSMNPRPTAIFCANDEMALGLITACQTLKVRIPEDVSIVGFDNAPLSAVCFPPLTTIRQPLEEMGAAATLALFEMLSGRPAESTKFLTQLIVRATVSCPLEDKQNHE